MKKKNEDNDIIVHRDIQVKLLKLAITKFEGTHLAWFRFLDQFETETERLRYLLLAKFLL